MDAVEPGCPQDDVARANRADGRLACGLGPAIGADRSDWIVFAVSADLAAVEDVVRRNVEEWHARAGRRGRQYLRTLGVGAEGFVHLALGLVDFGVAGCIDDQ